MGYSPWGCKESDTTEQLTLSLHLSTLIGFGVENKTISGYLSSQEGPWTPWRLWRVVFYISWVTSQLVLWLGPCRSFAYFYLSGFKPLWAKVLGIMIVATPLTTCSYNWVLSIRGCCEGKGLKWNLDLTMLWPLISWLRAESLQSFLTLCDSMDCSLPGSSVHGILQARILEWVAMPSSRGSSWPGDWTTFSAAPHCRWILYHQAMGEAHITWER